MRGSASLQDFSPLPGSGEQFDFAFMERYGVVKLREAEGEVWVGALDDPGPELLQRIEFSTGSPLRVLRLDRREFSEYISSRAAEIGSEVELASGGDVNLLDRLAADAPVVNLVNSVLLEGLRLGCSDIHLEGAPEGIRVRFRVDGLLRATRTLPKELGPSLSSRIKIMANLNIIERRLPQDGKMCAVVGERAVEFRVSIMPTVEGESIVLRLFNRDEGGWDFAGLGFEREFIDTLRELMRYPQGLVLVAGPTGSGKTTTLNSVLRELNAPDVKILTIEDPVENKLAGVCQIQTNEDIGMTFDSVLRRLLRQDPDILMIGEVRDRATADLALRSALTGHRVWATLHANDALSSVDRLVNMGLEPYLLEGTLRGAIAQRLARRLCPACAISGPPDGVEEAFLRAAGRPLELLPRARGCEACDRGYKGRVALGEIFAFDSAAGELIAKGRGRRELEAHFRKLGASFLLDSGLGLVERGVTTLAEVERVMYGL